MQPKSRGVMKDHPFPEFEVYFKETLDLNILMD